MRIKVYVILKYDGNVCCPAYEVDRVYLSRGRAKAYCDEMNALPNEDHRRFEEHEAT